MSKKPITDKRQNEEVQMAVVDFLESQEKFKQIEKEYNEKKKKLQTQIKNFMFVNGFDSFKFLGHHGRYKDDNRFLRVSNIKPKRIEFNVEALEKKLDKELLNEILIKEYLVKDMEGLIKYLKSCGVNPKKFKKFIDVRKQVDKGKIDELGQLGDLTLQDLNGCYTVKESEGYLKITELSDGET